jgi:hypothetical protein
MPIDPVPKPNKIKKRKLKRKAEIEKEGAVTSGMRTPLPCAIVRNHNHIAVDTITDTNAISGLKSPRAILV